MGHPWGNDANHDGRCIHRFHPRWLFLRAASHISDAPIKVVAAGSLREVLTEIAQAHEARTGQKLDVPFAASGLLRERIEKGEAAQVFASADMRNPQKPAQAGGWTAPRVFARNQLCALTQAHVITSPERLLALLLDPRVRLATSTPKADPSGDYAWALLRKAEAVQAGAYAVLDRKALQLTGGPSSPKAPAGRGTYAWIMDRGQADVFLTYCTNAVAARREVPRLRVVDIPAALQVGPITDSRCVGERTRRHRLLPIHCSRRRPRPFLRAMASVIRSLPARQ